VNKILGEEIVLTLASGVAWCERDDTKAREQINRLHKFLTAMSEVAE